LIDHEGGDRTHHPPTYRKPNRIFHDIRKIKRYFQQRRTKKKEENPANRAARSTARATWAIAILTVVTIGVGVSQYIAARNQLTLTFPPRLRVNGIHIWEKGKGGPFNPENKPPPLIVGTHIEGAVMTVNFGRESATIVRSDCLAVWWNGPLPMSHPLWGHSQKNEVWPYEDIKPDYKLIKSSGQQRDKTRRR